MLRTLITTTVLPEQQIPTAVAVASPDFGVIGSVVKVDGRQSTDPDGAALTYTWTFDSVPIGSQVVGEGFRQLDTDGSTVSFSPDIVGEYVIGLVVSNGLFDSSKTQTVVSIRAILVPHAQGIVPDGKWIWNYIRDVWQGVENKEMFETLWSALIQITSTELIKLYEVDFNKSIRDTQDLFQRRWISYEPRVAIKVNGPDFFFGNHYAGTNASTINLGLSGTLIIVSPTELVLVGGSVLQNVAGEVLSIQSSRESTNIGSYSVASQNSEKNGYLLVATDPVPDSTADRIGTDVQFTFNLQSTHWKFASTYGLPYAEAMAEHGSPLDYLLPFWLRAGGNVLVETQIGDVIHFKTGPNKGYYRITNKSGSFIDVDHAPPSFSDAASSLIHKADIFRPVRFSISQPDSLLTDTIAIPYDSNKDISTITPGRVIIINGQTYTITRASLDTKQRVSTIIVTVDRALLQSGLNGLSWRTPPTVVSTTQDFDVDGVSPGDTAFFDIIQDGVDTVSIPCQVLGVDRGRFGVVFTTASVQPGQVPPISNETYLAIADAFGIQGVTQNADGTLSFSGQAATFQTSLNSATFKATYWNKELTPDTNITVNPTYQIKPRYIIRNKWIPVDTSLKSIPLLQNFIVQPTVTQSGSAFFQQYKGQQYPLKGPPLLLKENIDYVIDNEVAFQGQMTFKTGSDVVEVDGGDFIDKNIGPGDQFIIENPITLARTYYVQSVLSSTKLKLTRPIPLYALDVFVTASVKIQRRRTGNFIRFIPGRFTAQNPAPDRLWAEVSFFDNNENIENNFGILVGLSRDDIEKVSEDLNYRQAVAGIMYAYLKGSAIEKIRLGAQILLGLPFAEIRGVIRSIETDYRLDISGNPILGRLLIEDVDATGTPLGTLRIYTYPIDPVSTLAGLETNPATGDPYAVGDIVEKFAALSKGVEILDYVSNPLSLGNVTAQQLLQQYHSLRLRVNDTLFTIQELGLVSSFLKKITPSYVAFFLTTVSEIADTVQILDDLTTRIAGGAGAFVDNASLCLPLTMMFDSKSVSGIKTVYWGDGAYWMRRSGSDLVTTLGSNIVTVPSNGILSPRANESFEAPLTVIGDKLLILTGDDTGIFDITGATNSTITINGPTFGLQAGTGIRYAILRLIKTIIRTGTATVASGNPLVTFSTGGLRTEGVAPGDWLLNIHQLVGPSRYMITEVVSGAPGTWNQVRVTPTPQVNGTVLFAIARSKVFESLFPETITITGVAGNLFSAPVDSLTPTLLEFGDELEIQSGADAGSTYMVIDPETKYIVPALAPAATASVKLKKKFRASTTVNWSVISLFDPIDQADAAIVETQNLASCTTTSNIVPLQIQRTTAPAGAPGPLDPTTVFVRPGDLLKLSGAGNGAVDIGFGAGVYPIVVVTSLDVRLSVPLTVTESVAWSIIRRR